MQDIKAHRRRGIAPSRTPRSQATPTTSLNMTLFEALDKFSKSIDQIEIPQDSPPFTCLNVAFEEATAAYNMSFYYEIIAPTSGTGIVDSIPGAKRNVGKGEVKLIGDPLKMYAFLTMSEGVRWKLLAWPGDMRVLADTVCESKYFEQEEEKKVFHRIVSALALSALNGGRDVTCSSLGSYFVNLKSPKLRVSADSGSDLVDIEKGLYDSSIRMDLSDGRNTRSDRRRSGNLNGVRRVSVRQSELTRRSL
ncbi:hypothetical protein FA15DRAFT_727468 [Coprinopsis marcescibilis]|uniref:Uncharacterized protein n=1 Tax=Coprinopsis marcescibilis TaxID=230819 RepID=A0A5C3KG69_COPMA|nr:hypothetical protein FA15DRAFT_727468 [Coprinopsis marcescibilis]